MACSDGALYPGVPAVPLVRGADTPLAGVGTEVRELTVPLGAAAPRPGGAGGAALPRPLGEAVEVSRNPRPRELLPRLGSSEPFK